MKLRVIKSFIDKKTKEAYNVGSFYESDDEERIKELQELGHLAGGQVEEDGSEETGIDNADDKEVEEYPKHIHGPNWELSNGEKFQGSREEAVKEQEKLEEE